jgi:hypothetical protein
MSILNRVVTVAVLCSLVVATLLPLTGCSGTSEPTATTASTGDAPAANTTASADVSDDELKAMLDEMIDHTRDRHLSPQVNNAWQIVHALLAYGKDLKLFDQERNQLVPALEFMAAEKVKVRGWDFAPGDKGVNALMLEAGKVGPGHDDQWIGYLAQAGLSLDEELIVKGQKFTWRNVLEQAKWNVRPGMEATWTLMAGSKYLSPTEVWKARDGGEWSMEKLVDMECDQKLGESACGGSHRMYGITTALNAYKATGGELKGGWKKAQEKIDDTIRRGREFQQPDGGFSTQFFERSASSGEIQLRINTTGHVFEYLALALDDKELKSDWMRRGALFLCRNLQNAKDLPLECGGLYHAAHGLILYRERMFGPRTKKASDAPTPPSDVISASDKAPTPPSNK